MASTNQTTHYNLSQYIGTDKPTYLVDYNGDMLKIDTGIYNAKNEADTNTANIGTLSNLTTDAKSNLVSAINEIDGHTDTNTTNIATNSTNIGANTNAIGSLASLETTAKTSLVAAVNEIVEKFNLSTFLTYDKDDVTSSGCTVTGGSITVAKNNDGSICKVYGTLVVTKTQATATITLPNTGISVDEEITVSPCGVESGNTVSSTNLKFNTNGSITLTTYGNASGSNINSKWFPFIIFVKNFGDVE